MAGKRTSAPKRAVAGKDAAQPAATAPAEQLGNQPAGTTQADASASTDTKGVAASAAASTEQTTASEAPAGAAPAVDGAGGTAGQDAHLNNNDPAASGGDPVPPAPLPYPEGVDTGTDPLAAALAELEDDEVEGLWVVAIPEHGFRRLGYRFTRDGFGIALAALTAEQIEILENEPNLKVERGVFSGRVGERLE